MSFHVKINFQNSIVHPFQVVLGSLAYLSSIRVGVRQGSLWLEFCHRSSVRALVASSRFKKGCSRRQTGSCTCQIGSHMCQMCSRAFRSRVRSSHVLRPSSTIWSLIRDGSTRNVIWTQSGKPYQPPRGWSRHGTSTMRPPEVCLDGKLLLNG